MKRFLSILISVSMILTLVCVPVSASAGVTYTAPASIYYKDFSDSDMTGISVNANGSLSVKTDSVTGNNYLTLTNTNGAAKTTVAANSNVNAKYYVAEYKIKSSLMENKNYAIYTRDGGGSYHAPHVTFYKGYLYKNKGYTSDANKISTEQLVKNNTWYTVTVIYDGEYVNSDGTSPYTSGDKYIYRDIYLDGKPIVKDLLTSAKNELPFISKDSGQMALYFETYGKIDFDIDYVKFYASADDFAAKLPKDTGVSPTGIEVYFNNIPTEAELLTKATVVDSSGNKVAGIASVTHNNNFDPGEEYAQSITLNFDTELAEGTSYKLNISGLSDFAGNTLSTQLDFKTSSTLVTTEWSNHKSIAYWDFEEVAAGTYFAGSAKTESVEGLTSITADRRTGTTSVVTEGENNYFNLSTSASSDTQNERFIFSAAKASVPDADKYIIEYKIRNDLGLKGVMKTNPGQAYGVNTASFYQNRILTTGADYVGNPDSVIGSYEDGEWYTVTVVYDGSYKTVDGVEKTVRDIYINGELAEEDVTEDKIFAGNLSSGAAYESDFINQAYLMRTALHLYGTEDETSQSVDIDYVKFYASADTFAAKLGETEEVSPDIGIEVQFNNIPVKSDLLSKVKVINATTGEEVCGISSVTYNNNFNVGETYAQSVTLNFDKILSENTTYKLRINGVKDISNNTTNLEESFTTGEMSFEYGNFEFAEDNKTVSIDITKNISADKVYTLIIAGYEEYNGGLKMVSDAEKDITITSGTNTYTSNKLDITGDYVKAFLWDDMKPVVTQGEKPITQ